MESRISRKIQELEIWPTLSDTTELADRLAITFLEESHGRYATLPDRRSEAAAKHLRKVARQAYRRVLDHRPHSFLGFILTVSPRTCRQRKIVNFIKDHNPSYPVCLGHDAQLALMGIARSGGFHEDSNFLRLIELLFRRPSTPAERITEVGFPLSRDASKSVIQHDVGWVFPLAQIQLLQVSLGDRITRIMELTAHGVEEGVPAITQCIQSVVARGSHDALVYLKIERDDGLAQELFPNEYDQSLLAVPDDDDGHAILGRPEIVLRTSRVAALKTSFTPVIYNAFEESELRKWEKEGHILTETRCVELRIHRKADKPWATLRLRLAPFEWTQESNKFLWLQSI